MPVRVVDTGMVAMALGFCALAAAEAAEAGGTVDEAVTAAEKRAAGTSAYFYVDTLDYLRRGGRIGAAQALLGSALAVKPLLQLRRRPDRACWRRCGRRRRPSPGWRRSWPTGRAARQVDIAVHHLAAPDRATALADRLRARVPGLADLHVSEVGAVIGAHTGPGSAGRSWSHRAEAGPGRTRRGRPCAPGEPTKSRADRAPGPAGRGPRAGPAGRARPDGHPPLVARAGDGFVHKWAVVHGYRP